MCSSDLYPNLHFISSVHTHFCSAGSFSSSCSYWSKCVFFSLSFHAVRKSTVTFSVEPPSHSILKAFLCCFCSKQDKSSCSLKNDTYFQVKDTTFSLDIGSLIQHSDPLHEILQIEPADGSEGTEKNPIVVNGVTVQWFESFMSWLNHL